MEYGGDSEELFCMGVRVVFIGPVESSAFRPYFVVSHIGRELKLNPWLFAMQNNSGETVSLR